MVGTSSSSSPHQQDDKQEVGEANNRTSIIQQQQQQQQNKLQVEVSVSPDGGMVNINFGDGTNTSAPYHASWLWSNDPKRVHVTSGQRTSTPGEYYRHKHRPKVASARIIYIYAARLDKDDDYRIIAVHNIEDDATELLQFPGPTMGDSCHPLATYGEISRDLDSGWLLSRSSNLGGSIMTFGCYLQVEWKNMAPSTTKTAMSIYDLKWLSRFRYADITRKEHRENTEVTPIHAIRKVGPPSYYSTKSLPSTSKVIDSSNNSSQSQLSPLRHEVDDGLVHIDYQSMFHNGNDEKFQLLHHVFRDGAVIVTNTPSPVTEVTEVYPVAKVAKVMSGGSLSHGSLYGDIFHVRDDPNGGSNNVAYTSLELCPHQDLAYYESPPGMQLLHCVSNGKGVIGGESLLIDAMAAAYRLREIKPKSFEMLTRCPATFVKQREGACMTYRTPHIVLAPPEETKEVKSSSFGHNNIDREILAVWWSPPFEGPVYLPPEQVDGYYEAYADFELMLNTSVAIDDDADNDNDNALSQYAKTYTWERKLKPGEMLVFNNRRMLHGRRGFSVADDAPIEEGQRHLVGCYTNIDDTLNSYRVLLRNRVGYGTTPSILNVGNGTRIFP